MKKNTLVLASLLIFSFSLAQQKTVSLKESSFKWTASKKLGSKHYGKIFLNSAKWDEARGELQRAEFIINMKTFTVDDLDGTWKGKFLAHVKSKDFFEVSKYPEAKLIINKKTKENATGSLTIKGKTHPVKVNITSIAKNKNKTTYKGKMTFDRTKFNIIYNSGNFFKNLTAKKIINDNIDVNFKVVIQ